MKYLDLEGLSYFYSKLKLDLSNLKSTIDNYTINGYKLGSQPIELTKIDVGLGNVTNDPQVKRSEMGAAYGVATLDSNGLVPSSQLPSYVDDILEYDNIEAFPETGETGKIYVSKDTNLTYRWTGSSYIEISKSLALGETSSTAYSGDKGKANRDALNSLPSAIVSSISDFTYSPNNVIFKFNKYNKSGLNYTDGGTTSYTLQAANGTNAGLLTSELFIKLNALKTDNQFDEEFTKYVPIAGGTMTGPLVVTKISINEGGSSKKLFASDGSLFTIESITNQDIDGLFV